MTYAKKLKDPRWQKKRLEILEIHNFECMNCGDKDTELHVHHCRYKKGREPWEYDDDEFFVLCKPCHDELHIAKKMLDDALSFIMDGSSLLRIAGYAVAFQGDFFTNQIQTQEMITGLADYFRTNTDVISYILREEKDKNGPMTVPITMWRQVSE